MDKYISGIAAIIGGICTVFIAVLGFFLRGKFEEFSEKVDKSAHEKLESRHDNLAEAVAELKDEFAGIDKAHAVMVEGNKSRDEKLDKIDELVTGIDGKLDELLMRPAPRGSYAGPRS